MAQLDPLQKISHSSKNSPKSNSATFEQFFPERSWSTCSSPNYYDHEETTPTHGKKSVISKVKEKAKKLKYSLSGKKKLHENDVHEDNSTPPWGVSWDDDDEKDEDPEYLGAPMYESELAPEPLKEAARQHPRADPVLSEKHITPRSNKRNQFFEHDNSEKLPDSPSKTITETVTETLGPAYAAVSDATHAIASKISNLTLTNADNHDSVIQNAPKNVHFADVEQNSNYALTSPVKKWDKGVSVKEYFAEKFEPGEGERSLSQIITEAMSPRQSSSGDIGIVEKMKGAVTSFIQPEYSPKSTTKSIKSASASNIPISTSDMSSSKNLTISTNDNLAQDNSISMPHKSSLYTSNDPQSITQFPEFHSARSSPLIPFSSSDQEVVEEQTHGRILQPN